MAHTRTIVLVTVIIVVIAAAVYFFATIPEVISVSPVAGGEGVEADSVLIIRFDRPVRRTLLEYSLFPEVHGEWQFEGPLLKNHLFRTLVFRPAVGFVPETEYQILVRKIAPFLALGVPREKEFLSYFKTRGVSPAEAATLPREALQAPEAKGPQITLLDIPIDWQDDPLSCEAASLKMALGGKGVMVSEDDIMAEIGYDPTPRKGNVWGDPFEAFVGSIMGSMCTTGYGVYAPAVADAADRWSEANAEMHMTLSGLVEELSLGNPVIVWGTLPVKTLHDCSWVSPAGKPIKAFKETHVRLAVGFVGDPENPEKIILNDPLAGRLYWPTAYFLENWKRFDNSAVVVR